MKQEELQFRFPAPGQLQWPKQFQWSDLQQAAKALQICTCICPRKLHIEASETPTAIGKHNLEKKAGQVDR